MENLKEILREWIDKSPLFETLVFAFSVIVSGILTGSFVTELTVDNRIQWSNAFNIVPTYLLLAFLGILYFYNRFLYKERLKIKNFEDEVYISAYFKKEILPEVAKDYRKSIREGDYDKLKRLSEVIDVNEIMDRGSSKKGGDK